MFTQIVANVLIVTIAAGMTFQLATLARYAARIVRQRRTIRARVRPAVRAKAPLQPVLRRVRRRDYRLALRAARVSVSA